VGGQWRAKTERAYNTTGSRSEAPGRVQGQNPWPGNLKALKVLDVNSKAKFDFVLQTAQSHQLGRNRMFTWRLVHFQANMLTFIP